MNSGGGGRGGTDNINEKKENCLRETKINKQNAIK
jgi:hypothetical protein